MLFLSFCFLARLTIGPGTYATDDLNASIPFYHMAQLPTINRVSSMKSPPSPTLGTQSRSKEQSMSCSPSITNHSACSLLLPV